MNGSSRHHSLSSQGDDEIERRSYTSAQSLPAAAASVAATAMTTNSLTTTRRMTPIPTLARWGLSLFVASIAANWLIGRIRQSLTPQEFQLTLAVNQTRRIPNPETATTAEFRILVMPPQSGTSSSSSGNSNSSSSSSNSTTRKGTIPGIQIYAHIGCPPMSDPPTETMPTEYESIQLPPLGGFGYQRFRVNAGSTVTLEVQQVSGQTDFYFMGEAEGMQLHDDSHYDFRKVRPPDYSIHESSSSSSSSLTQGNSTTATACGSATFLTQTIHSDELYTLVYVNPMPTTMSLFNLKILRSEPNFAVREEHLLQGLSFDPSSPAGTKSRTASSASTSTTITTSSGPNMDELRWDHTNMTMTRNQCIIVKGVEWKEDGDVANDAADGTMDGPMDDKPTMIYVTTLTIPDVWSELVLQGVPLLLIPLIFSLGWFCSSKGNHRTMHQQIALLRRQQQQEQQQQQQEYPGRRPRLYLQLQTEDDCEEALTVAYAAETTAFLVGDPDFETACHRCDVLCAEGQELQFRSRPSYVSSFPGTTATRAVGVVEDFPCGFCRSLGCRQVFANERDLAVHMEQEHGMRYERDDVIVVAEAVGVQVTLSPSSSPQQYGTITSTNTETITFEVEEFNNHDIVPIAASVHIFKEDEEESHRLF